MPTAPRLTVPGVSPAPLPGVRVTPTQPALGPDFSGPINALGGIVQEEQQKADAVRVNDADNQATVLRDRVLYGEPGKPETGLLGKRGQNAFGGAEQAIQQWNEGLSQIGSSLNDRQKLSFHNRIVGYDHNLHLEIQAHVLKERREYDLETTKNFVDARIGDAVRLAPTDPSAAEQNIERLAAAVRDQKRRDGAADDVVTQAGADATSQARLEVMRQYHALGQDQSESAYLEKHRDQFVGRDLVEAELLAREGSTAGKAVRLMRGLVTATYAPGILEAGNIDLVHRPRVVNQDGSVSTLRSISIEEDGKTILIPTVSPQGKVLSNDQAIDLYHRSKQHLGVFANQADADRYAQQLHALQERGLRTGDFEPTFGEAIGHLDQELDAGRIDARVYEAAERQTRQHYADKDATDRQERAAAFEQFGAQLEKTPDLDAIRRKDPQGWLKLSLAERNALEAREEDLRHPTVRTDDAVFAHLTNLASLNDSTREQFKSLDIVKQYGSRLSQSDVHHFLTLQANARLQDEHAAQRADESKKRSEEREVIKATATNERVAALRANLDPKITKYLPPVPRVRVPQWMVDSARVDPEYKDYLERHGVNVDAAPAGLSVAPADTANRPNGAAVNAPGAPIIRVTPQQQKP